jgi:hypothetical protein
VRRSAPRITGSPRVTLIPDLAVAYLATVPRRRIGVLINLDEERVRRRVAAYERKISRVLDTNRRALGRLFATGALFTRQGTRAGRDLLLAHQHMLRVVSLLRRLSHLGEVPPPRKPVEMDAIFVELDDLLERTSVLTHRTGDYLAKLRME